MRFYIQRSICVYIDIVINLFLSFLLLQIGKQVEHALFSDPASNGTVNEANLKYAFGPQGLNIQISNEDVKVLVEEANKRFHGNVNVGSFVQSLRIKDPSMDVIPLFDARESFISRLKTKIGNIDETCASPKLMGRISELTCELDTATGHVSRDISHGSKMSHSMSSGTILRPRTSSNLGTLHKSASEREFSSLAHSTKQMSLTDTNGSPVRNGRSASGTISLSPLPNCNSPATVSSSKHNSQVLYPPPDFSPTAVSNPTTVETTKKKKKPSRHRDPADIMLEELELAKTPRHEGTKRVPVPPTDWTRVGVGGNGTDTQSGLFINEQSQFLTQSMATFSEVQFAPGIGSVREGEIGDAERLFLERERKRNERYARTANNLKVTQTRLELEELNEQMTQLRRSQRSAQGMLNYSSKVFARDMKELKRQPLHCMQRKPNPKQFKFMWSGTFHPAHHVDSNSDEHTHRPMLETKDFGSILSGEESARFTTVAEDREFKTTYSNTFNREALVDNGKHTVGNMHNRPGTSIY